VANDVIGYRLQRVRRRSIGLQVDETGLTIRAPRWSTLRDIEAAIVENLRWIRRKQREWRELPPRQFLADASADGGTLQYLGRILTLRLGAECSLLGDATLSLALPVRAAPSEIADALKQWLQQQARIVFADRIDRFADRTDSRFAGWQLSSARTQWGSCSPGGRIRLNWRLVHYPLPIIDYVIAHELAHLTELNHGPRFWAAVARLLPGFETAREQIKRERLPA
jgi:predicted metal-dependent hydrolase